MTASQTLTQEPDQALLEMTRWFLLSVLRHLRQEDWQQASASGLSEEQQYDLANRFLNDRSVRQSVRMVLRDPGLRNQLVGFAGSRDVSRLVLSDGTRAFKQAVAFWEQHPTVQQAGPVPAAFAAGGAVDPSAVESVPDHADQPDQADHVTAAIPNRRAARRARPLPDKPHTATPVSPSAAASGHAMSEEEYQQLEQALASGPVQDADSNWVYRNNEDRISLLAGLLTGAVFFALVLWLFL